MAESEAERVQALEDALRFYADRENWRSYEAPRGYEPGPAVDGGERAREALRWG